MQIRRFAVNFLQSCKFALRCTRCLAGFFLRTTRMASDVSHYWEDDSSGDDRPQRVFAVDEDDNGKKSQAVPTSAAEYLRSVRREASALPNVFVSEVPSEAPAPAPAGRARPQTSFVAALADSPRSLLPSASWAETQLAAFVSLQERLCKASEKSGALDDVAWTAMEIGERPPDMSVLACGDSRKVIRAITYIDEVTLALGQTEEDGKVIRDAMEANGCAQWLYALLARIEM